MKKTKTLTKEEKQKLVFQLVKETKQSIRKCTQLLEDNNWVYPIVDAEKEKPKKKTIKRKTTKSKKGLKSVNLLEDESKTEESTEEETFNSWNYYLKREKEQKKQKVEEVNPPAVLGKGYYTMKEIVAFVNNNIESAKPMEYKMLDSFNKKHNSKYSTWDELSDSKTQLTEDELIQYKDYISWYTYIQHHKLPNLSKKNYKLLKDKIEAATFFNVKN